MVSIKTFIRVLSINLAHIHFSSKEFAKDKLLLFAGQKNFSGRTLKYIYNTIKARKKNLSESIISVIDDCYCNSYKNPIEMRKFLIELFNKKSENYNEIMNFLRRDEEDVRERYKPLYLLMENYINESSPFKFSIFLDLFNNILFKDVEKLKERIEEVLENLQNANILNEYYIFFRILYNILDSLILAKDGEKIKEQACLERKIIDPFISRKLKSVRVCQKKYLLLSNLLENNLINLNIKYEDYNAYELKIKRTEDIKNPYFELFTEEQNLVSNSVTLSLLYPEVEKDDKFGEKIKLNGTLTEIVIIIIKIINKNIKKENSNENVELNILKNLQILETNDLFINALEETGYKIGSLDKIVTDKMVVESNRILSIIKSLKEENLEFIDDEEPKNVVSEKEKDKEGKISEGNYVKKKFEIWATRYDAFNGELISANFRKKGKEEEGRIEEEFKKLIKKLEVLNEVNKESFIKKAIKYLGKVNRTSKSLKNAEKYVDSIIDEYQNIKSEEGKKKSLIKFDIKPGDYIENYEPRSKFQKVIKSLIEYTDCINIVEEIKNKKRIMYHLNKIDKMINNNKQKNILKKSFKILRKSLVEDDKDIEKEIQYFKDILLSKLLQEFINIDEECNYLHMEKIISEFNKYKEREKVNDDERKYASYLATLLDPTYEIIIPNININSILLLFAQKTCKKTSKTGLFFKGNDINLFEEGRDDFIRKISELQDTDLSKINLLDGLNKFVDICIITLFEKDEEIQPLLEGDKNQKQIINYIYNKEKEIKLKDNVIKQIVTIIKNFYDSFNYLGFTKSINESINESFILNIDETIPNHDNFLIEKSEEKDEKSSLEIEGDKTFLNNSDKFDFEDFFFINDFNWRDNIDNTNSNHRYLIYYFFKNPQIEIAVRTYLLETETFKSKAKDRFPIYVHLLRVFSTKSELSFQGTTKSYTSNLIEKFLVDKIKHKQKKLFINNISWIGLLINNALTLSNKFIPKKISYLYNYLSKIGEIQFKPSSEFKSKYEYIIERLIDFILESCFNKNIEDIFELTITKFEDDKKYEKDKDSTKELLSKISKKKNESKELLDLVEDIEEAKLEIKKKKVKEEGKGEEGSREELTEFGKALDKIKSIHYFTHLNEIIIDELEEKDKKEYELLDKKLREISKEIESSKKELNFIYDKLIKSINNEIIIEKKKRYENEIEKIDKNIFDECEELQNDANIYKLKYEKINFGELPEEMFNNEVIELLNLQEKLLSNYGKKIFLNEKISVLEINLPKKYIIDDVRIMQSDENILRIEKENLSERIYFLPIKYYKSEMFVKKDKKKEDKIILKDINEIKKINIDEVEKIKSEIQDKKKEIKLKDIKDIEVKLIISDRIINKEIEKDDFLLCIQEISKKVSKLMKRISEHLNDKKYILGILEKIKEIIDELSKLSLNDPKFIDEVTDLSNTKTICDEFQTHKNILIKKFELIRENYLKYKNITEQFKNDKDAISESYQLVNEIKFVNKTSDFSTFKQNSFNSPYIMLSNDNKTIQGSYRTFKFIINYIIPSLFGNSIYSVNIFSFVNKNLKAEIIKEDNKTMNYSNLFFVPNYIPALNPLTINFIIPEKKIEKEEKIEFNPNIKLSGSILNDINPIVINTKFIVQFLPLRVVVFSKELQFSWKNNKLIINKEFIKRGHPLKINFKIIDFKGNYDFLENNYTLNSLENNGVDLPKVSFSKEGKSNANFKIDIQVAVNDYEKLCHGLFSVYFSKNLIIPIEINSKVSKNNFELFYYDIYEHEIKNHNNNNKIKIYKYFQNKDFKKHLYFRVEFTNTKEHNLDIKLPPYNKFLNFGGEVKGIKVIKGKTITVSISINSYKCPEEYEQIKNVCNKKLEIEFNCDGLRKSFRLDIQIENCYEHIFNRIEQFPYFTFYYKKLIKLTPNNYKYYIKKRNYIIYHNYDFYFDYLIINDNCKKEYPKLSKLILIINELSEEGFTIWEVNKDNKLEAFFKSDLDINENNLQKAKKEISEVFSKFNLLFNNNYEEIENMEAKIPKNIESIQDLIIYLCSINIKNKEKVQLLMDLAQYFTNEESLLEDIKMLKNETNKQNLIIIYHNIIFKLGNIFKKRKEEIKQHKKNYYSFLGYCLNKKFTEENYKEFNEAMFENNIKNMVKKDKEEEKSNDDFLSNIWQFNEYEVEPIKLKEIPKEKESKEETEDEKISDELKMNEDILNNNKIEINKVKTINEVIELFKKSSILAQLFPFLIGKINSNDINTLFNKLYSIYIAYKKYDKSILSVDSIKFCKLFENICMNLRKYKIDLNNFEEIKNLSIKEEDGDSQSINLSEYPKPQALNIPKDFKWFKSTKEKLKYERILWEKGKIEKEEEGEFVMKPKITKKEKNKFNNIDNISLQPLEKTIINTSISNFKKDEEEILEDVDDLDEEFDSDDENLMKYEKETAKIEEIGKEKIEKMKIFKDDKNLTKHIINLMTRNKKVQLRIPELLENNELNEEYFKDELLYADKKNLSQLLLDLSNIISYKLFQASVNQVTDTEKICSIIAIDCCRTIDKMRKFYHAILAFGMINCLNAMEIPYSVVIFADYQFLYTIKKFEKEHTDEIYKIILDCIMIPRYSSRIADACYYIDKKVIHPQISNRRIFFISNGLDPKLKSPNQWSPFFGNEKDKYCFYFIKPEMTEENEKLILNIWETFRKETGNEVVIIKDLDDILEGEENIYTKFGFLLSEKVILSKEEIDKIPKNLNNLEGKFYEPIDKEICDLEMKNLLNIIEYLKYSVSDEDFYLKNKPHIPSNINKIKEREITINHPFIVKSINFSSPIEEKLLDKLSKFENKGVILDLIDTIFPPNKPSMYAPSVKGTRLYLVGLVKFIITAGQENKIWLEKKAGLKRDYRVSVIIDSSKSCFNNINSFHSFKTIFSFLKCLSLIDIPYFDLIIATDKKPINLCLGYDTTYSLNNKSKIWQALASQLFENNYYKCNIKDCLFEVLKLKSLNLSKESYTFILTDGLFNEEDTNSLRDLISFVEENFISVFGIGLGLYPEKLEKIFTKSFWSINPNNLLKALSVFFGNEISHKNVLGAKPNILEKENKLKEISEIIENYNDYITYRKLSAFLEDRPFSLESMEETVNRDEADKIIKNPDIDENNTMCRPNSFLGLKVLCCCFWSKEIAGEKESDWIDPKYLTTKYSSSCGHCLKDAFDYYGIKLIVKTKYDDCIKELQKGGKYYAAWIICSDGAGRLPGGGKANIVGQFIEVLNRFWMNGGALLFWCDNEPLTYEANLFLEKAEFPGNVKSKIRFVGNHLGQKEMKPGKISSSKVGIFNDKRQFEEGKIKRYSLGHNLKTIFEGTTVSFAKIKVGDVDEDNLKEDQLEDPLIETLLPFVAFSYDHDKGLSVIFYPSGDGDNRGDIIIDGGFSKLFNEIDKTGTYRYVLNSIAWTTQFSRRTVENGDNWVENFNLASFKYDIKYDETWKRIRTTFSNEFDIIYLIDATGSMTSEINAAKEQVITILKELQSKYPTFNFNFGAIFYRDKIDSPSDKNDFFPMTDDMESLKEKISTVKAYGGGDEAEDWVEGYKLAINNISWREGSKLIIHIADAGAHGTEFSGGDNHLDQGPLLPPYIQNCVDKNIKIIGFQIGSSPVKSFKKLKQIYDEYKSTVKDNGQLCEIYEFKRGSTEEVCQNFKDLVIKAASVAAPKINEK